MIKNSYTIDLVHDSENIGHNEVCELIRNAIEGITKFSSVHHTGTKNMSEQGMKVWAKRKVGISLATPKPAKIKKVEVGA